MQMEATKRLFTVGEYYRMVETELLREDDHTELIAGEIFEMSPMGARHAAAVLRVNELFMSALKGKATVGPQLPLRLDEFNEPEPDISLLKPRRDFYALKHPGPADAFLVVEIADSSLHYDRDVKLPMYATARIPEVWIADLKAGTLLVYRDPSRKSYKTALVFHRGDSVRSLAFPDTDFAVDDILG